MFVAVTLLLWVGCGAVAYAGTLGHFQRKFPSLAEEFYWPDVAFATSIGLCGPIGLITVSISSRGFKHGLQWK